MKTISETLTRIVLPLCILSVFTSSACFDSKTVVTKVKPGENGNSTGKMNGIFYALPRTVVTVSFPLERKDFFRGKFHEYAAVFFPDDDMNFPDNAPAGATQVTKFAVKPAIFDSRGEPDPDEIYMVSVQGGRLETKSLLIDLTDDGVLSHTKSESKDDRLEFVTGAIKTGASIVGSLLPIVAASQAGVPDSEAESKADTGVPKKFLLRSAKTEAAFLASITDPDEILFYTGMATAAEKQFYRSVGQEERDFYRLQLTTDAARSFYRSLTVAEAATFRAMSRREQNSFINLTDRAERIFYSSLDTAEEKEFFANLPAAQRPIYMVLTGEQATLFRTLTPEQAQSLVPIFANPVTRNNFFEAKKIYDKIREFIQQREALLSLAARSALPADTLNRLLSELDSNITGMKNTYFLGNEIKTESSIGTFHYRPPTNLRLAVGRPYSAAAITEYLREAGFANLAGGAPGSFTVGPGGVVVHTRLSPATTITIVPDAAGSTTSSINAGIQSFELKPETIGDFTLDLFSYSGGYGICDVLASEQGVKRPPKFVPGTGNDCAVPTAVSTYRLRLSPGKDGRGGPQPYDRIRSASLDDGGQRGFSYRYPAGYLARVESITTNPAGVLLTTELNRGAVTIAQLGLTVSLPASTKGRRTSYELALYEKSGALKNFNMGSDAAIQKSILDDLGGAATTIIDAEGARRQTKREAEEARLKAQSEASDEINILEREKKLLELRKAIEQLRKELEQAQN